jgi:hypothetical protein
MGYHSHRTRGAASAQHRPGADLCAGRLLRHFAAWTLTFWLALLLPAIVFALDLRITGGAYWSLDGWLMPLAVAATIVISVRSMQRLLALPRH